MILLKGRERITTSTGFASGGKIRLQSWDHSSVMDIIDCMFNDFVLFTRFSLEEYRITTTEITPIKQWIKIYMNIITSGYIPDTFQSDSAVRSPQQRRFLHRDKRTRQSPQTL